VASGDTTPPKTTQATSADGSSSQQSSLCLEQASFTRLLELSRLRDPAALSLLYRRFLPIIYRFIHSRTSNSTLAEDLTSDTFFSIMEGLGSLRAQDELGFATWALGIARNKLAVHFRRVKSRPEVSIDLAEMAEPTTVADDGDPLAVLIARERWAEVVSALNRLTLEQRETLWRRCLVGESADEVAHAMGKPTNAIYGLQFRALAALARYLKVSDHMSEEYADDGGQSSERRADHAARRKA